MIPFLILLWSVIAVALDLVVKSQVGEITVTWKRILFVLVTLPILWFRWIESLANHYVVGHFAKIAAWFKS